MAKLFGYIGSPARLKKIAGSSDEQAATQNWSIGVLKTQVIQRSRAVPVGIQYQQEGNWHLWIDGACFVRSEGSKQANDLLFAGLQNQQLLDTLRQLHGTYVGVAWNEESSQLHFFSGPRGIRPLYLWQHPKGIAWATEQKQLLAFPHFPAQVAPHAARCFMELGFLPGEVSWFPEVVRLPAGQLWTYHAADQSFSKASYWSWPTTQVDTKIGYAESLEEGYRIWQKAIQRRLPTDGKPVSVSLSGGIDSRLILAELQQHAEVTTFTFGQPESWDVQLARRVQQLNQGPHQYFALHAQNWWEGKEEAVWQSEGLKNLVHLHASPFYAAMQEYSDYNFNGFLGGAAAGGLLQGGSWTEEHILKQQAAWRSYGTQADLQHADWYQKTQADSWMINHRIRRFSAEGVWQWHRWLPQACPLADDEWLDWLYLLPPRFRSQGRWLCDFALRFYPTYFKEIPIQRTGLPIDHSLHRFLMRRPWRVLQYRLGFLPAYSFADYRQWLRESPDAAVLKQLLSPSGSRYFTYLGQDLEAAFLRPHLEGKKEYTEQIGRALTLELWLRALDKHRSVC